MKTIKSWMCGQVRAKHPHVQPTETLVQFVTLKQEHKETLSDCDERFNQGKDNFRSVFGAETMISCVKETDEHKHGNEEEKKNGKAMCWTRIRWEGNDISRKGSKGYWESRV